MERAEQGSSACGRCCGRLGLAAGATSALGGCELIGDVFQAGVWFGVIVVVALIAVVIWVVSKAKK